MVCANIISFLLLYSLAAYSCQAACPGGSSDECPGDSYCYADVPCTAGATPPPIDNISGGTTTFDKYCGTSPENAAENCWQPCRDNADCCAGQTCHGATSCPVYANNVGADHFFCGTGMIYPWRMSCFLCWLPHLISDTTLFASDFCDATSFCHQPCPSGEIFLSAVGQIMWMLAPASNFEKSNMRVIYISASKVLMLNAVIHHIDASQIHRATQMLNSLQTFCAMDFPKMQCRWCGNTDWKKEGKPLVQHLQLQTHFPLVSSSEYRSFV